MATGCVVVTVIVFNWSAVVRSDKGGVFLIVIEAWLVAMSSPSLSCHGRTPALSRRSR
jgi:hypothetical protein